MNEIKILQKLISLDSQCTKSNKKIVEFLASLFPAKNCRISKLKKGKLDLYNLTIKFPGRSSNNPLIFSGHTDTVPASNNWTLNPFESRIKNGKIYGLGSTDMKAGLAALLAAALSIKEIPAQDVYFLFDADEEDGCTGGFAFLKNLKIKPGSAQIIVAEPTDGALIVGQKGAMDIRLTFFGKSFHASITSAEKNQKHNAINKAIEATHALKQLESEWEKNPNKLFGPPTQAVCLINGGTASNVIPDKCEVVLSRRFLPMEKPQNIIREIKKIMNRLDGKTQVETKFIGESNLLRDNSPLLLMTRKISRQILKKEKIIVAPYWTQAGNFKRWGDCLIWGPGIVKMAHQANEYCPVKQVTQMAQCYKMLIQEKNQNLKKSKKSSEQGSPS